MMRMHSKIETGHTLKGRFWLNLLIVEIALILFFIPAGRFHFDALHFSTGYDAYKLFPLLVPTWWLWRLHEPQRPWPWTPMLEPLAAFWFISLLAAAGSLHLKESISESLEILAYIFFYLLLLDIPWNSRYMRWVGGSFVIGNIYLGGVALLQYSAAWDQQALPRISGTYNYPNALGIYAILGFTLLNWLLLQCRTAYEKAFVSIALAAVLLSLVVSLSRAAYIALAVWGLLIILSGNRNVRQLSFALFLLVLILALVWTPQMMSRVTSVFDELQQKDLASRFYIWPAVMDQEAPEFFFFGRGLGPNIPNHMSDVIVSAPNPHALTSDWHPHNLYLDLLFSMGMIGVLAFFWIIVRVSRMLKQDTRMPLLLLKAGLLAFLVHQCFEVHLLLGNIPIALIVILALCTYYAQKQEEHIDAYA